MRYIELIADNPLVWGLFLAYLVFTSYLAWLGHKRTGDIKTFAIGKGDMHPVIVGLTLAASMASTATFVINPGFVYVHGLSAFMHFGVAVGLGITVGLVVMSTGFRRIGASSGAITLPQWMGKRYASKAMAIFFAGVNLLSLSFVVLIVAGLSIVMQQTLGLTNVEALVLIIGFVFSYTFIGGAYAHAYTNTLQGALMVIVTVIILASGFHLFGDGVGTFFDKLEAVNPNLVALVNPESPLFGSWFSIYVSGFVIGVAIVSQPHIMTKALYVKDDKAVRQYLAVALGVTFLFFGLLVVGLYAHVQGIPVSEFTDPNTGAFRQDMVMTVYLKHAFGPGMLAVVTVAVMSAGMSTLDGILVALSTMTANDLFLNVTENNLLRGRSEDDKAKIAHRASQIVLILMAIAAFLISLDPPKLLGIFGQLGVYGIIAASTVPILVGILGGGRGRTVVFASAIAALVVHLGLYGVGEWAVAQGVDLVEWAKGAGPIGWLFDTSVAQLGFRNPGVTATYGILTSVLVAAVPLLVERMLRRSKEEPATTRPLLREVTANRREQA